MRIQHDRLDMAYAVMEGVAHVLKKNLDQFKAVGSAASKMISTGGGARSPLWNQLKADLTGYQVVVPENEEAACLGAAMMGAVSTGIFSSYKEVVETCVSYKEYYRPKMSQRLEKKHKMFNCLYEGTKCPIQ